MFTAISTPIIFPKIVPNDWDEWNKVWNKYKKFSPKIQSSKNSGSAQWIGFDIYVKDGVDATNIIKYKCENINCPELFNSLFDNLDKLPIDLQIVRVLQSISPVGGHHDFSSDSGTDSIRSILYDNNPKQTWWYETEKNEKHYLRMPDDTNTWWYNDVKVKHGTDFIRGYGKQLIMYRGAPKDSEMKTLLDNSIKQYADYVIYT
jgi:hypothetical protein